MALGTPTLATTQVGASADNTTTASFTPTASSLLIAYGHARGASSSIPAITDSLGNTWTLVPSSNIDGGASAASLYYYVVGGAPAARTVTATSTGATQTGLAVIEVTGADDDVSNFAFNLSGSGDPDLTMAAYTGVSLVLGFYMSSAGSVTTPPSGFPELFDANTATNLRSSVCYENPASTTNLVWTGGGVASIGMGLEIREAAAGGGAMTGSSTITFAGSGTAKGAGALPNGTSTLTFASTTPFLRGLAPIAGSTTLTFAASGATSAGGDISGSSSVTFAGSATLGGAGALVGGTSTLTFTVEGSLDQGLSFMEGSSSVTFSVSGAALGLGQIAGLSTLSFNTDNVTLLGAGALPGGTSSLTFTTTATPFAMIMVPISGSISFGFTTTGRVTTPLYSTTSGSTGLPYSLTF